MFYEKNKKIAQVGHGSVIINGYRVFNPTAEMLEADGWTLYTPPETDITPIAPMGLPKRYSQLKIIRALGDAWVTYKAQLESAGLLDQFFAADYLQADDPVFAEFIETVPDELKSRLDECLI